MADKRKRLTVALNLNEEMRSRLNFICELENRTPTQQIEYFLTNEVMSWWKVNRERIESALETSPELKATFEKSGILKTFDLKSRKKK